MKDLLTIDMTFSEYHLIFPRIVLGILVILLIVLLLTHLAKRLKDRNFTFKPKFFKEGYDKKKFFGTIILLVSYVFLLEIIGFLASSILFMFLIMLLFIGNMKRKSIIFSVLNSVVTSFAIWYLFGTVFNITLP
ncbi:tripartite tricarboxylate transporter TctB family protein [Cytobacillus gottheilii]|uniref:Tripartite tricarboxylate transporter TctB family protein n=1 Tax=Cytobacillus gottheilii TaxID=859144 RepID=A0ABX8F639_9BACI|nr:tripartite tricarboxylate transporter TctB family protein [Cytobacillus gottheilii]QVY59791.1 tripartite tricarboxylate transporter TctB family protein [Cytobacillus gottheilii]